ncbi:MAG: CoxG family protein [Chloroflexota bacterium]
MDRSIGVLVRSLGARVSRRAGIGGVAAGLLSIGLNEAGAGAGAVSEKQGKRSRTVRVSGTETFDASPGDVWDFVTDPESAAPCSPAFKKITSMSRMSFNLNVSYRKGCFDPSGSVEGTYSEMVVNESGRLSGTGKASGGGKLSHDLSFVLRPVMGTTEVDYDAKVTFTGILAYCPQNTLEKHVNTVKRKYVKCMGERLGK